ncbi:MAG: sulfite exporter TauE/SafE family protein [Bacteroidetes bacterium]|nr:sulfite exporter TauE/SafE family protein [Bacteroidota bacterium]
MNLSFHLLTALTIGLVGSLHCIGMCGPIAVALPLGRKSWADKVLGSTLYNFGRAFTYGIIGALFGLLGKGLHFAGLQQWASIAMGVVMIVSVLFPVVFREKIKLANLTSGYSVRLISRFRELFGKHSHRNLFIIGLLNGLLPCGLVYVAVAGAVNTNDVAYGALFMIVFGLGTLPVMMALSLVGNMIGAGLRSRLANVVPVFIVMLGIVFILRGMALGIPYISPKTQMLTPEKEMKVKGSCCTPARTKPMQAPVKD